MMYLSDPALLEVLSPPRYVFMKDYFDNHLQTQKKDAFNSHIGARHKQQREEWNNKGFDDSDVRYIYQVS